MHPVTPARPKKLKSDRSWNTSGVLTSTLHRSGPNLAYKGEPHLRISGSKAGAKEKKSEGVIEKGECGDDVVGLPAREK